MFAKLKDKQIWRWVGIVLVGDLVFISWWVGWFEIVFYVLGLYAAVYIVSYIFKTTAIISLLLTVGGIILYLGSALLGLYLFWIILTVMFTGNFFLGLLFLFLLGTFGSFVPMAIGLALGYPLVFMSEDIEKRFQTIEVLQPKQPDLIDIESE